MIRTHKKKIKGVSETFSLPAIGVVEVSLAEDDAVERCAEFNVDHHTGFGALDIHAADCWHHHGDCCSICQDLGRHDLFQKERERENIVRIRQKKMVQFVRI